MTLASSRFWEAIFIEHTTDAHTVASQHYSVKITRLLRHPYVRSEKEKNHYYLYDPGEGHTVEDWCGQVLK